MYRGRGRGSFVAAGYGNGQRIRSTMAIPSLPAIGEQAAANGPQQTVPPTSKWPNSKLASNKPATSKEANVNAIFAEMSLQDSGPIDPSNAPKGAAMDQQNWRNQSQVSTKYTGATKAEETGRYETATCVRSQYSRKIFRKGQIVSLPYHVPNTNDTLEKGHPNLTITIVGPVYSKQRMAVVLHRYKTDMFCLPLFSFGNRGILAKPKHLRAEFVEITNVGYGDSYITQGKHEVIEAKMDRALTKTSVVHISGGMRVSYQEDVGYVGELTEDSRARLTTLWNDLNKMAQAEPY